VCQFDLAQHVNKTNDKPNKLVFQKCFDKNANIIFSVRSKEIFAEIQECVQEDKSGEASSLDDTVQEEENKEGTIQPINELNETSRFSKINSGREC